MSCITTYTGIHIDPTAPEPEQFDIRDIAHALSLICRGNGHVKTFFSVGQHCIWCCREALARGLSRETALACLLHDASEAYLSDVPRPFKQTLPAYREYEDRLLFSLYLRFLGRALTDEEAAAVKEIDDAVLYYDLRDLLSDPPDGPAPALKVPPDYSSRPFRETEETYLSLFHSLSS